MKKIIFLACMFMVLGFSTAVFGAPYLVCDPNPGAEKIILEVNGVDTPEFLAEVDGSLKFDLAGFAEGDFTVRAKAKYGVWGWSEYSIPFDFTKPSIQAPMGLRVSSE